MGLRTDLPAQKNLRRAQLGNFPVDGGRYRLDIGHHEPEAYVMPDRFNVKLGALLRRPVVDSDGIRVGLVEDVWLENDGDIWLVVGGNFIQELLAKLHIRPDIELLVPREAIERVSDEIQLKWSKFQLESTCEECWNKEKERLVRASANPDHYTGLHLISHGLWGFEPPEPP